MSEQPDLSGMGNPGAMTERGEETLKENLMMGISNNEVSELLKKTGAELTEEYHIKLLNALQEVGVFEDAPLEIWIGLADAFANASGYRVVLQAAIMEPVEDSCDSFRIVGRREVAVAEPMLFTQY